MCVQYGLSQALVTNTVLVSRLNSLLFGVFHVLLTLIKRWNKTCISFNPQKYWFGSYRCSSIASQPASVFLMTSLACFTTPLQAVFTHFTAPHRHEGGELLPRWSYCVTCICVRAIITYYPTFMKKLPVFPEVMNTTHTYSVHVAEPVPPVLYCHLYLADNTLFIRSTQYSQAPLQPFRIKSMRNLLNCCLWFHVKQRAAGKSGAITWLMLDLPGYLKRCLC